LAIAGDLPEKEKDPVTQHYAPFFVKRLNNDVGLQKFLFFSCSGL
jgi:hypothetical protein